MLKKDIINKDNYEIYLYGSQIFLELSINIFCSIVIAIILNMKIECILFFLFFIPLRSYNGGFHMDHYLSCLFLSCVALTLILMFVKYCTVAPVLSYLLYAISVLIIKEIGPINHPNRSVNSKEDIEFKKRTNITLVLSFIISVIFLLLKKTNYLFLEALVFTLVSSTLLIGHMRYSKKK